MEMPASDETTIHCRHCGESYESFSEEPMCPHCGRYEDSVICPTCGQLARPSLMKAEDVPSAAKAKKSKE